MNIRKIAVAAVCAAIVTGHACAATTFTILAKPGATLQSRDQDQALCTAMARRAPDADLPYNSLPANMAMGGVGENGLPAGVVVETMFNQEDERAQAVVLCMHYMGYVDLPLTPEESEAYRRAAVTAQRQWEAAFLASDFSARYRALATPLVPPLPAYREEAFTQGGLKIDGDSLKLVATSIEDSGDLVTGKATRVRTATLVTPIQTTLGTIRVAADPGTVFHQVDYRPQFEHMLRSASATWCGPVRQIANGNTAKDFYCFTGRSNGYEIYRPSGQPWLAGPYTDGLILPVYDQPIRLEERAQDDLGPMDFTISVTAVHFRAIDLVVTVRHDGAKSVIMSRSIRLNPDNTITLPLWAWRLKLKRISGGPLQATLDHDGDGTGWRVGG